MKPEEIKTPAQLTAAIDSTIRLPYRSELRRLVRHYGCKLAVATIEHDAVFDIDNDRAADLSRQIEKITFEFSHGLWDELRKGCDQYRFLELDFSLYWLLRDTLRNRAQVWIGQKIEEYAPAKQAGTLDVKQWPQLLTATERQAIQADLKFEKLTQQQVDAAYVDAVITVGWLSCSQLLCVGFRTEQADVGGIRPEGIADSFYFEMIRACDYDLSMASAEMSSLIDRVAALGDDVGATRVGETIHARTASMFLASPMPWPQFRVHLLEHLPDRLSSLLSSVALEPVWWEPLCASSVQLAIMWDFGQINHGPLLAESRLREITILADCLRPPQDDFDELGGHASRRTKLMGDAVVCTAHAIALDKPWADGRQPFDKAPLHRSDMAHTFLLTKSPFADVDDLLQLEGRGYKQVYAWMLGESSDAAIARRALGCYATANLLAATGSMSPLLEDAWQTVALWACLEIVACPDDAKKSSVFEYVHTAGKRVFRNPGDLDRRVNVVRVAGDRRNDTVHAGKTGLQGKELRLFSDTVRVLLGDYMKQAAALQ